MAKIDPQYEYGPIDGEPSFRLLARDPQFSLLVDQWVTHREALVRCGELPASELAKIMNAKIISSTGAQWRKDNMGKWREKNMSPEVQVVARAVTSQIDANDPVVRQQIERAMADPERMMPSEKQALENKGFLPDIPQYILDQLVIAAKEGHCDLATLMAFIKIESNFDPYAQSKGGSSAGLMQFTHDTWTEMVHLYGNKYKISEAMVLDARANAIMGAMRIGMYMNSLGNHLVSRTAGNAYCLHFLGMTGGMKLISAVQDNPTVNAFAMFPIAAAANPNVFTLGIRVIGLYNNLVGKVTDLYNSYTLKYASLIASLNV